MPELLEVIRARRSIRRYADRPVPRETLERVLTAAVWAPSAHNRQPWRFAVLTEVSDKVCLAEAMGARLRADRLADGDPAEVVELDVSRSRARIVEAPVVILACLTFKVMASYPDVRRETAEHMMAVQSMAMALQNLLLASHAEGLGACWMCAPLFCPEEVRGALDLSGDWEPQALITLGYPASAGKAAVREGLGDVVLWK